VWVRKPNPDCHGYGGEAGSVGSAYETQIITGIAGYYVLKAIERDLIGWAMTNSTMLVAPFGARSACSVLIPIAIAFRARKNRLCD